MQSSKGYLFLLIVLILAGLSTFAYMKNDYQYGLDIQGGIRLTYKLKDLSTEQRARLPEIMSNLVNNLSDRAASTLGVQESTVQPKGEDELIVELPGFTNPDEARSVMSSTAKIQVYHCKNLVTDRMTFREYREAGQTKIGNGTFETFARRNDPANKEILPGTADYVNIIKGWDLILEGTDLASATIEVQGTRPIPHFKFTGKGAENMERFSRQFFNQREKIAFVLDNRVLNVAPVQEGAILRDDAILQGEFDPAYANQLVNLLKAGSLPVSLEETSNQTVDPTIGKFAKTQMVNAGVISFAVIGVFLLGYYLFPGLIALIALLLYCLFSLTVMKLLHVTFSLAAMAGFILSVGMAVDANILVFERAKEEMREGRSLLTAVELGFKRALNAIIDSNLCTILTSLVLMWLGTGPVKGFATTLILGVAISFFTAVSVTRSLLVFFVRSGLVKNPKVFALDRQIFGERFQEDGHSEPIPVVQKSMRYFMISLLTIIPGAIFLAMGGLKPNVEFQGGFEATYKITGSSTASQIVSNLASAGFPGSNAKIITAGSDKFVSITVPPIGGLKPGDNGAYKTIAAAAKDVEPLAVPNITSIGPTIQQETIRNAALSVCVSSLLIVFYLGIRFGSGVGGFKSGIKFGLSAIGALLHDILVVVGVAAIVGKLLGWEVSALFLTAMLTVIGFSVHDTIVIFDRIRENLHKPQQGESFEHLCNRSITQSFARSIITSMSVILTLIILIAVGTATIDLKFFCVTMLVGIISGTYSSIFNATPILYLWDKANERKKGPEFTLVAEATAEINRLRALAAQTGLGAGGGFVAGTPGAQAERGYGQVKRRDSVVDRSKTEIDDD